VRPGEPVSISLELSEGVKDDWTINWDLGDGKAVGSAWSITHAYGQRPERTGDTSNYTLAIAMINQVEASESDAGEIRVFVQDTRIGSLFADETWVGTHTVTGPVIVPAGKTLTIQSLAVAPQGATSVTFEGGLSAGYDQGIRVSAGATLKAIGASATPIVFDKPMTQSQDWVGILVDGDASLSDVILRGAIRAITAEGGARLSIDSARIESNETGLHVLGMLTSAQVRKTVFANNAEYGVKEDDHADPDLDGTVTFSGNWWNYYAWDGGILNADELKKRFNIDVGAGE
jgi:hypothetical protein